MSESENWQPPTPPTFGTEFTAPIQQEQRAGFWIRFLAYICDQICVLPIAIILVGIPSGIIYDSPILLLSDGVPALFLALVVLERIISSVVLGYWIGSAGGSPLRIRLGVYVVDENNGSFIGTMRGIYRVAFANSLGTIGALISFLYLFTLLDYISMLWNPNKQTWHDKVAQSVVVKR